jgi:hypothetical protein
MIIFNDIGIFNNLLHLSSSNDNLLILKYPLLQCLEKDKYHKEIDFEALAKLSL